MEPLPFRHSFLSITLPGFCSSLSDSKTDFLFFVFCQQVSWHIFPFLQASSHLLLYSFDTIVNSKSNGLIHPKQSELERRNIQVPIHKTCEMASDGWLY